MAAYYWKPRGQEERKGWKKKEKGGGKRYERAKSINNVSGSDTENKARVMFFLSHRSAQTLCKVTAPVYESEAVTHKKK